MEQNVMNSTKMTLNKFKQGRGDLKKEDGQTKDRVEVWRKNLYTLTDDVSKQVKMLEDLDNGGSKTAGEGGSEHKKDYFDHMVNQISKEIQELISICKSVLSLPQQHINKQKKESMDGQWRIIIDQLKNEVTKILSYSHEQKRDNFELLAKLLNLKENLLK